MAQVWVDPGAAVAPIHLWGPQWVVKFDEGIKKNVLLHSAPWLSFAHLYSESQNDQPRAGSGAAVSTHTLGDEEGGMIDMSFIWEGASNHNSAWQFHHLSFCFT